MAEFHYETERLILRDWREEDWAPFWEGTNTPAVMQWLGGVMGEAAMASQRARLEQYSEDFGFTFWALERREDQSMIGFCGLKRCTDENGPKGEIEAGWRLCQDAWGKGYAKEAAIATLDLAFERFGAERVIALTVEGNRDSWGLMRRLGMRRRPEMDLAETHWNADYGDVIVHAITREEWESRQ